MITVCFFYFTRNSKLKVCTTMVTPVVDVYEAAKAQAMWNYILLAPEDACSGIHNPTYAKDLIKWSLA